MSYANVLSDGVQFVANYGSDSDDGWSVGTAKATCAGAFAALPGGNSAGSAGTGVVFLEPTFGGTVTQPTGGGVALCGPNALSTATFTVARGHVGHMYLNYAGSMSGTNAVGAMGIVTIDAATTVAGSSYLYGAQGKLVIKGTMSSQAEVSCGLKGQLDVTAAVGITGPIAVGWFDCGATASAGAVTGQAHIDGVVVYNTTTEKINAALRVDTNSSYFMDLTDEGGGHGAGNWIIGTAKATGWDKSLKIKVNGTDYYIPLNPAAS